MSENNFGRFVYVEPNDLNNNGVNNIIQFAPEDYCISVGLEIELTDRYAYGSSNSGKSIKFSSDNGTISFFGGTKGKDGEQGYLTTSFTNVSSNDKTEGGIRECLGIDSIDISYDTWNYPQVDIKFVDVRGSSLFLPEEKALDEQSPDGYNGTNGGSFFKSLFTFPYPLFKLSVKGFYGKEVTYNLTISQFNSEFDCERGYFTANVHFIGYLYGVYTDTPMSYLSIAPYIDNKKYWNEQVSSGKFVFKNGTDAENTTTKEMMTIPEFRGLLSQATAYANKESQSSTLGAALTQKKDYLEQLNSLNNRFNTLNIGWKIDGSKHTKFITKIDDVKNYKYGGDYYKLLEDIKNFDNSIYSTFKTEDITDSIETYLYNGKSGYFLYPRYKFSRTTDGNGYLGWDITCVDEEIITEEISDAESLILSFDDLKDLLDNIKGGNVYVFTFTTTFSSRVDEKIKALENDISSLEENLHKDKDNYIRNYLGFDLSIENIFKLMFAHYETFIYHYYQCLTEIKEEGDGRDIKNFSIQTTDANTLINPNIPPFTAFYEVNNHPKKEKEQVLPQYKINGNITKTKEEVFIEKLLSAARLYAETDSELQASAQTFSELFNTDNLDTNFSSFIPLTLKDYIQNKDGYNPYSEIFSLKNDDRSVELLVTIFYLRAYYLYYMFGNSNINLLDTFVDLEYENFIRSNPKITKKFKESLSKLKKEDGLDFVTKTGSRIWEVTSDCNDIIEETSDGNGSSWKKVISRWIKLSNDGFKTAFPIGNFNISNIKSDIANGSIANSDNYLIKENDVIINENSFNITEDTAFFDVIRNNVKTTLDSSSLRDTYEYFFRETIKPNSKYVDDIGDKCYQITYQNNEINNIFGKYNNGNRPLGFYPISKSSDCVKIGCEFATDNINGKFSIKIIPFDSIKDGVYNKDWSIFNDDFYNYQDDSNIYAKAYLFLYSTPITEKYVDAVVKSNNCSVLKTAILREGAYYARKEGRLLIAPRDNDKMWGLDEVPITKENGTFNVLSNSDTTEYFKWSKPTVSNGRIKTLINYFEQWATTEFSNFEYYRKNNKEKFDTELYHFYQQKVVILDYCNSIKSKEDKYDDISILKNAATKFINAIKRKCDTTEDAILNTTNSIADSYISSKDLKLATYINLKNLYDKWYCSRDKETWMLGTDKSDFERFEYVDSFYNKIGRSFMVNGNNINEILSSIVPSIKGMGNDAKTEYNSMSFYEFMCEVCQKNNLVFMALPQRFGMGKQEDGKNNIVDMFTPWPYSALKKNKRIEGSYVCLYAYRPSSKLCINDNNNQYSYVDDGFDITDGKALPISIADITDGDSIPAFGVSFAKQNQSLFRKISLNMDDKQETDVSISTTMAIAQESAQEPRETVLYGQDIYRVYASYSYTCGIEMMGNAQIVPLMYFQLNNVPMWKGAYMITKVSHSIRANNMSTTFTGVRQNRFATPLTEGEVRFIDSEGNIYSTNYKPLTISAPENAQTLNAEVVRTILLEDRTIGKLFINGEYCCDTLEDRDRDLTKDMPRSTILEIKEKNKKDDDSQTAIPYGEYGLYLRANSATAIKYGRKGYSDGNIPALSGVTGYDGILLHIGNSPKDTHGCILLGRYNPSTETLVDSIKTFQSVYFGKLRYCKSDSKITIKKASDVVDKRNA